MKSFLRGLIVGFILQIAIGPVFFFIVNLTLQKTIFDGFAGVLAVTIADFFYIALSILGVGKLLEKEKIKRVFGIASSLVLIFFAVMMMKEIVLSEEAITSTHFSSDILSSFLSVFVLTISSPLTIIFFTSLFAAKALEYNYVKNELWIFGLGTGMATLLFMTAAVMGVFWIKESIPEVFIQIAHMLVGGLLIGYGVHRFFKIFKNKAVDEQ